MAKFGNNQERPRQSLWRERKNVQKEGKTLPFV